MDEVLAHTKAKMKELATKLENSQQENTWLKVQKKLTKEGGVSNATDGESCLDKKEDEGNAKVETEQDGCGLLMPRLSRHA